MKQILLNLSLMVVGCCGRLQAQWVLQIDSDGQCDPEFFAKFWEARSTAVFGCRVKRDDGISRWLISRVVSLVVLLHTGSWIKDANVPYRLLRAGRISILRHASGDRFGITEMPGNRARPATNQRLEK